MSLFKLVNLWSFTLNQLEELTQLEEPSVHTGDKNLVANFRICLGTFKSVGEYVALVCGSLSGLLCIIQIPEDQTTKHDGARQLLAAKKLNQAIVDLKCGFFSSTVKQSIAVLTLEELSIYQVKKSQPNLLSGNTRDQQYSLLEDGLFSHSFEEIHKFSLTSVELPAYLSVSSQHSSSTRQQNASEIKDSSLTLPQRDYIVVQYTNQFFFTLVNHKKIIAHYKVKYPLTIDTPMDSNTLQMCKLSSFLGAQAMSLVHNMSSQYLVVAMSNNYLYNFSLTKLIELSKENVMKRVVNSLLTGADSKTEQHSSLSYDNTGSTTTIELDLKEHCDWQLELTSSPLQMQSVSLDNPTTSQIIVLSRYFVDVYSISAQHLWSYRSETPLICIHCYITNDIETSKRPKLVTLLCSDTMNEDRCNLLVMEDGIKVWSSLMYQKPSFICRTNLINIQGAIVSLGIRDSCLNLGYFGTNCDDIVDYSGEDLEQTNFSQLESLGESIFDEDQTKRQPKTYPQLSFDISLQASNKWPEVRVETKIDIKPDSKSLGVLQNVVLYLEYDDLLNFIPDKEAMTKSTQINEGASQLELGTYWADSSEPLSLRGTFSLKPMISIKTRHAFPRTNQVQISLKFFLPQNELLVQHETFLLPLTLMANLTHIEYLSQDQLLDGTGVSKCDFLTSVPQENYKYLSIIASENEVELIELIDMLIESDLLCRGFNSESKKSLLRASKIRSENYANTIENLNLLSQSLDCRLRYKSQESCTPIPRQEWDTQSPLVAVKIAFEFEKSCMFPDVMLDLDSGQNHSDYITVCLYLHNFSTCDSQLSNEVLKEHFKRLEGSERILETVLQMKDGRNIISIESEHPLALLLVQQQLIQRLNLNYSRMESLQRTVIKSNDKKSEVILSLRLSHFIENLREKYVLRFRKQFEEMKEKLNFGFYKFHLTSMAILSYSKRLSILPEDACNNLDALVSLNRKYQLHLIEVLSSLETLNELDRQYSKIPDSEGFTYKSACQVQLIPD